MSGIYTIGLRLVAHNHAGGVLSGLAAQLMHVHGLVNQTNMALGRFRQALVATAGVWAGSEMVKGALEIVNHGKEFQHIQNTMAVAGWSQAEAARATAKAWELTAKYQTVGPERQLKMLEEMAPVLGSPEHAIEVAPYVSAMVANLQAVVGDQSDAIVESAIKDAVRGGELSGNAQDMKRFQKYIDGMTRTLYAFGGTITPNDYMQTFKYGRAAGLSWSDEFVNYYLPTLMQMGGGSSTGNALMGLTQALIGGHMTKASWAEWDRLGLVDVKAIEKKWGDDTWTNEGKLKHWDPHALKQYKSLMDNPFKFAQDYLVPAMIQHGVITKEGWSEVQKGNIKEGLGRDTRAKVVEELYGLLSNRVSQGVLDQLVLDVAKFQKDSSWLHRGDWVHKDRNGHHYMHRRHGSDSAQWMQERDYEMGVSAFKTQWEALMTALSLPSMRTATDALGMVNGALSGIVQTVQKNPAVAKGILGGMTAGGAALAIGSALRLAALLVPGGPLVLGLIALGGAVATLAYQNWDAIKRWWSGTPGEKGKGGEDGIASVATWKKVGLAIARGADQAATTASKALGDWWSKVLTGIQKWGVGLDNAIASMTGPVVAQIQSVFAQIKAALIAGVQSLIGAASGLTVDGKHVSPGPGQGPRFRGFGLQKQGWVPPSGGSGPTIVHTALHVDGRKLAERVSYHQAQGGRHVGSGATFDGTMSPMPVDQSWT